MASADNLPQRINWPDLSQYGLHALYQKGRAGETMVVLVPNTFGLSADQARQVLSQATPNLRRMVSMDNVRGGLIQNGRGFALTGEGIRSTQALANVIRAGFPEVAFTGQPVHNIRADLYVARQRRLARQSEQQDSLLSNQPTDATNEGAPSPSSGQPVSGEVNTDEGVTPQGEVGTPEPGERDDVLPGGSVTDGGSGQRDEAGGTLGSESGGDVLSEALVVAEGAQPVDEQRVLASVMAYRDAFDASFQEFDDSDARGRMEQVGRGSPDVLAGHLKLRFALEPSVEALTPMARELSERVGSMDVRQARQDLGVDARQVAVEDYVGLPWADAALAARQRREKRQSIRESAYPAFGGGFEHGVRALRPLIEAELARVEQTDSFASRNAGELAAEVVNTVAERYSADGEIDPANSGVLRLNPDDDRRVLESWLREGWPVRMTGSDSVFRVDSRGRGESVTLIETRTDDPNEVQAQRLDFDTFQQALGSVRVAMPERLETEQREKSVRFHEPRLSINEETAYRGNDTGAALAFNALEPHNEQALVMVSRQPNMQDRVQERELASLREELQGMSGAAPDQASDTEREQRRGEIRNRLTELSSAVPANDTPARRALSECFSLTGMPLRDHDGGAPSYNVMQDGRVLFTINHSDLIHYDSDAASVLKDDAGLVVELTPEAGRALLIDRLMVLDVENAHLLRADAPNTINRVLPHGFYKHLLQRSTAENGFFGEAIAHRLRQRISDTGRSLDEIDAAPTPFSEVGRATVAPRPLNKSAEKATEAVEDEPSPATTETDQAQQESDDGRDDGDARGDQQSQHPSGETAGGGADVEPRESGPGAGVSESGGDSALPGGTASQGAGAANAGEATDPGGDGGFLSGAGADSEQAQPTGPDAQSTGDGAADSAGQRTDAGTGAGSDERDPSGVQPEDGDARVRGGLAGGDAGEPSEPATGDDRGQRGPDTDQPAATGETVPGDSAAVRPTGDAVSGEDDGDGPDATERELSAGAGAASQSSDSGEGEHHDGAGRAGDPGAGSGELEDESPAPAGFFRADVGVDDAGHKPSQRINDNIDALETLARIEKGQRAPDDEELEALKGYTGWGGIGGGLGRGWAPNLTEAEKRAQEVFRDWRFNDESPLTGQEISSIESTVLNAHFTHSGVIQPMWNALSQMDVDMERVIEPSAGTLNFLTHRPEGVEPKNVTAVEIDPVTARIAAHIHPGANVINSALEKASVPENFYDLSISNVPFGEYKVYDRQYPKWKDSIHNYYVNKTLTQLREGGVGAFVISSYFMDSKDDATRQALMDQAHVIDVVRLPEKTFSKSTQTQVMTDIVFFQKKGGFTPSYTPKDISRLAPVEAEFQGSRAHTMVDPQTDEYITVEPGEYARQLINEHFVSNPDKLFGELGLRTDRFGVKLALQGDDDIASMRERLNGYFANTLPHAINQPERGVASEAELAASRAEDAPMPEVPVGQVIERNERFLEVIGTKADGSAVVADEPVKVPKRDVKRMSALLPVLEAAQQLIDSEVTEDDDVPGNERLGTKRAHLNQLYDAFRKQYGPLTDKRNARLMKHDAREPMGLALEHEDRETGAIEKAAIFERRTANQQVGSPESAETLEDALALSMTYRAAIIPQYMNQLLDNAFDSREALIDELERQGLAYLNPATDKPETPDQYLSGDLKPKIDAAKQAIQGDARFERNLRDLQESLPEPLQPSDISIRPNSNWLPTRILNDFLRDRMNFRTVGDSGIKIDWDETNRHFRVAPASERQSATMKSALYRQEQLSFHTWGTTRVSAAKLLEHLFTATMPKVRDKIQDKPPIYQDNPEETNKALAKLEEMREAFDDWIMSDAERARELTDLYNEKYNTIRLTEPNGTHMRYPGMASSWKPREHQNNFVWRAISGPNSMTAHCVGAGKTFQLVASSVRGKQVGRWNKPMTVVPNHMLRQFAKEAQEIYPNARILVMDKDDATSSKRAQFAAKCAAGDWDLIVCTHSTFGKIGISAEIHERFIRDELSKFETELRRAEEEGDGYSEREIQKKKKQKEQELERVQDTLEKNQDSPLTLDQMGIDFVGYDEAHYVKNLELDTARQIPGLSTSDSVRAKDMFYKTRYLNELHGGPYGVMMATATPISNSLAECYTFTRMLRPDLLENADIYSFQDWMGLFAEVENHFEIKPEGGGYQNKARLSKFTNVPELVKMVRQFMDVKTAEDLNLPSPEVAHETVVAEPDAMMHDFMKYLEARARSVRQAKSNSEEDKEEAEIKGGPAVTLASFIREKLYGANTKEKAKNEVERGVEPMTKDILLSIATDGRKAALDPRLLAPYLEEAEQSKTRLAADNIARIYDRESQFKGTQMVFCDYSSPTGRGWFNTYDDLKQKLMDRGIEEDEIAFIHHYDSDDKKEALFDKVRAGEVRVLMGSTAKMGVGTNVQERLCAMHQLDPPWKPTDVDQRIGRMGRQGNSYTNCEDFIYSTQDSFDVFMWETNRRKNDMIKTAMRKPEDCSRVLEDNTDAGYEDILAVSTGNPQIKEFMEVKNERQKLRRHKDNHVNEQANMGKRVSDARNRIERMEVRLDELRQEMDTVQDNQPIALQLPDSRQGGDGEPTPMTVVGGAKALGEALEKECEYVRAYAKNHQIGHVAGMPVAISRMDPNYPKVKVMGSDSEFHVISLVDLKGGDDQKMPPWEKAARQVLGHIRRIGEGKDFTSQQKIIETEHENLSQIEKNMNAPFPMQAKFDDLDERYQKLYQEVGAEADENKQMDPEPVVRFARKLYETGNITLTENDKSALRHMVGEEMASEIAPELFDESGLTDDELNDPQQGMKLA